VALDGATTAGRFWIGVTPMEAELHRDGRAVPGLTSADHGDAALGLREHAIRDTNRGREVLVKAQAGREEKLVVNGP